MPEDLQGKNEQAAVILFQVEYVPWLRSAAAATFDNKGAQRQNRHIFNWLQIKRTTFPSHVSK
jgi:hypothetical protein